MKQKNHSDNRLPDESKIRAEVAEAEAMGIHKEPVDFLSPVVEGLVESGHDDTLWPSEAETIEELTR